MKILLLGYGKMGKAIEQLARERNHEIAGVIDQDNQHELKNFSGKNVDVAIEFSQPDAAYENVKYCVTHNIPVVSGTTGWLEKKIEIEKICAEKNGTFFYASNYSIGVNIFFRLNKYLAKIMNTQEAYGVEIEEIHHTEKKDAPSGTAITLAEGIIESLDRKKIWENDTPLKPEVLNIRSLREDDVPGTHQITYSSSVDDIEITHTAHSREGFVRGAVMVAEWLKNKKGVFGMNDYLKL